MTTLLKRPEPGRTILTITIPAGMSEAEREAYAREQWALHIVATLLENRCPRCLGPLLEEDPDRPGWRRCQWNSYPDGWWRREPASHGIPAGYEWKLGYNPHTGEPQW